MQGLYTALIATLNTIADGGGSNLYPPELAGTFSEEDIQERIYGSKVVIVSEQAMLNVIYVLKTCMLIMVSDLTCRAHDDTPTVHYSTELTAKRKPSSSPASPWAYSATNASSSGSPATWRPAGSRARSPSSRPVSPSRGTGPCRHRTRSARRSSTTPSSRAASTSAPTC